MSIVSGPGLDTHTFYWTYYKGQSAHSAVRAGLVGPKSLTSLKQIQAFELAGLDIAKSLTGPEKDYQWALKPFSKSFPPYPSISCSNSSPGISLLLVWQSLAVVILLNGAN